MYAEGHEEPRGGSGAPPSDTLVMLANVICHAKARLGKGAITSWKDDSNLAQLV